MTAPIKLRIYVVGFSSSPYSTTLGVFCLSSFTIDLFMPSTYPHLFIPLRRSVRTLFSLGAPIVSGERMIRVCELNGDAARFKMCWTWDSSDRKCSFEVPSEHFTESLMPSAMKQARNTELCGNYAQYFAVDLLRFLILTLPIRIAFL